jgi:hypothetical protein
MTGTTLDAFDYVPRAVLEHDGHQLGMSTPELTTLGTHLPWQFRKLRYVRLALAS